jgi:hypothetical protein
MVVTMGITSNDVANQSLALIGDNLPPVLGQAPTFDSSAAGQALSRLYLPCYQTVAKQHGWDFARSVFTLALTGNPPPLGWAYEYVYPAAAIEVMQVQPPALADPNNPLPQNWSIGNTTVASVQTKVIWSSLAGAQAIVNNAPSEATWDVGFREAMVRLLASEVAMALYGRPDTAESYLNSGGAFETIAEGRMG